jgi:hypothetical protein
MVTTERPIAVMDLTTRWRIDGALLATAGLGFLVWSLIDDGTSALVAFAVTTCVAIVIDRWAPTLPSPARLAETREPLPDGTPRIGVDRYVFESACTIGIACALLATLTIVWADPRLYGGFLFAYGLVRFRGAARARRLERESRVRLSMGRSSWRRRKPAYFATPILF